jgi:small nuclear ribonucleoprotein (snRNP)-like protein
VEGVLRGYDQFMNIVLEDCVEKLGPMNDKEIGTVVSFFFRVFNHLVDVLRRKVVRGNSVFILEVLERAT